MSEKSEKYEIRKARGFILWIFQMFGFCGWTSAWNVIYLHPDHMNNKRLRRHERCHEMQMKREGKWSMVWNYTKCWIKHGYHRNPYEVEARQSENIALPEEDEEGA